MHIIPTVIEKKDNSTHAYDIYSRLLEDRIILLTGEINDDLASSIIAQLLYLDSLSNEKIDMYIHSPGGSISAGLAIYDTMNLVSCDVSTIGIGLCASMGAFLLSSGTPKLRYALESSEIMIHQPIGGFNGQVSDIEISTKRIIRLKDKLNHILANIILWTLKKH